MAKLFPQISFKSKYFVTSAAEIKRQTNEDREKGIQADNNRQATFVRHIRYSTLFAD
jgi:hypothetical protein